MTGGRAEAGFTLVEIVVSMAITSAMMACVFMLVAPAQDAFTVQPEAADVQQRVRVTVAMLMKDLMMAGAGRTSSDECADEMGAPVLPYRVGDVAGDAVAGRYYRADAISVAYRAAASPEIVRRTYYVKVTSPDQWQLMQYDGRVTDHPMLEDVATLSFEYVGTPLTAPATAIADPVLLDPAALTDGPWCPEAADPNRFDADLLRIRRVHVALRVQAPRAFRGPAGALFANGGHARSQQYVPDQEIRFDVAPRNMNRDR